MQLYLGVAPPQVPTTLSYSAYRNPAVHIFFKKMHINIKQFNSFLRETFGNFSMKILWYCSIDGKNLIRNILIFKVTISAKLEKNILILHKKNYQIQSWRKKLAGEWRITWLISNFFILLQTMSRCCILYTIACQKYKKSIKLKWSMNLYIYLLERMLRISLQIPYKMKIVSYFCTYKLTLNIYIANIIFPTDRVLTLSTSKY